MEDEGVRPRSGNERRAHKKIIKPFISAVSSFRLLNLFLYILYQSKAWFWMFPNPLLGYRVSSRSLNCFIYIFRETTFKLKVCESDKHKDEHKHPWRLGSEPKATRLRGYPILFPLNYRAIKSMIIKWSFIRGRRDYVWFKKILPSVLFIKFGYIVTFRPKLILGEIYFRPKSF